MTRIQGLKQEMGRLKNKMEHPGYRIKKSGDPDYYSLLCMSRECLGLAKQAYKAAGGSYILSKSEKRASEFDANIDAISKITFTIGRILWRFQKLYN